MKRPLAYITAPWSENEFEKIGFGPLDIFFFLLAIPCWVGFFIC